LFELQVIIADLRPQRLQVFMRVFGPVAGKELQSLGQTVRVLVNALTRHFEL
jgi:hypothetical protein